MPLAQWVCGEQSKVWGIHEWWWGARESVMNSCLNITTVSVDGGQRIAA